MELIGYNEEVLVSIEPPEDPDVCSGCGANLKWEWCECQATDEEIRMGGTQS